MANFEEAMMDEFEEWAARLRSRPPLLVLPENPTEADRIATYHAALAHGLSDYEAREEGWPSREAPDD